MDREERLAELREKKNLLEGFLRNPGWKEVKEGLDNLIRAWKIQTFSLDLVSQDKAFEMAKGQGHVQGLCTARELPQILLDDVKADLEKLLAEMREEGEQNG